MKKSVLILVMMLSGLSYSQDSLAVESYAAALGVGEVLRFGGSSIKFKKVISDSRCPKKVTCVWAGEARVLVEVYKNGRLCGEKILVTSGGTNFSSLKELLPGVDLFISALYLRPYPEIERKTALSQYRLDVEVRSGGGE